MHQVRQRITLFVFFLSFYLVTSTAHAGEAILTWDAPTTNADGTPLSDLAGYKVYYGTASKTYGTPVDAGNVTTYTVNNLSENVTYYFAVTAYDTSGNESSYSNEVFKTIPGIQDTVPPVISVVTASSITSNGAVITWNTDEASNSRVEYGTTISYGSSTPIDNTLVTSHSMTLSGLTAWTAYHFRVKSQDTSGNLATSADYTFTTLTPPDTTAPTGTISINNGAAYATSTAVTLTLSCNDSGTGCNQMQFSNDGTTWGTLEAYNTSKSWTLTSGDGTKSVYVRYRDSAGNISQSYADTITLDTTSPIISGVFTANTTNNGTTITWTTNEVATTQVEYGTTTGYGSSTAMDTNLVTSHIVSLTGLSFSTTYHFRVKSQDAAGNITTSSDYTFTTLTTQPDRPAAITDLMIRTGFSTRNSVILDWTATGADGTEGTASIYDLRISTKKIIEDGIAPAQDEINFSNAIRIANLSNPEVAGTSESIQVNQLETNSVYYFALKAIDDRGNISAISNVINGENLPPLPVTALRQGYTMISFPLIPDTLNAQTLLGGIVGDPVELYWWSSNGPGDEKGLFVTEATIVPGYGYFIKSNTGTAVLNITGTVVTDTSIMNPLQPGWNMIGNPYPTEVALRNTYIRKIDTGELKSYEDAVITGWIGNAIYRYNGSTYDFDLYSDAVLKLWQGYWIAVLQNGQYEMIIYKP